MFTNYIVALFLPLVLIYVNVWSCCRCDDGSAIPDTVIPCRQSNSSSQKRQGKQTIHAVIFNL